jgi:organic hydroperoxide reductase OsmC/OhrA
MALAGAAAKADVTLERIEITIELGFGRTDGGGFAIRDADVTIAAQCDDADTLDRLAHDAKANCPVSQVLGALAAEAPLHVQQLA